MIDVSAAIFSSLPLSSQTAGQPSSVALQKPPADLQGGNSLRRLAENAVSAESRISDFGPRDATERGFASLGASLQQVVEPFVQANAERRENEIPVWQQLLDQQQRIVEARQAAQAEAEARRAAIREQQAEQARREQLEQLFATDENEAVPAFVTEQDNDPETTQGPALPGQQDSGSAGEQTPAFLPASAHGRSDFKPVLPGNKPPGSSFATADTRSAIPSSPAVERNQQVIKQNFDSSTQDSRGSIDLFA
ncbi:MAG: hypothetical protein PVG66_11120 [Chromatiales bacterium]|jgi:hypothetical protein